MKFLIPLFFYSIQLCSQNSSIEIKKNILTLRGAAVPMLYGLYLGGNYNFGLETEFKKNQSLYLGYKALGFFGFGGNVRGTNQLILLEYKKYFKENSKNKFFYSPYLKFRRLYYYELIEPSLSIYTNIKYYENSIGLGFAVGKEVFLDDKFLANCTYTFGLGYFFGFNKTRELETKLQFPKPAESYDPVFLHKNLDIRLGFQFGLNVIKSK